jgi:hypothetical protein
MTRRHDLNAILIDVLTHFAPLRETPIIDWVDLDECDALDFDEHLDFACALNRAPGLWIGVHPALRGAPAYVLRYLVGHEVLHLALGVFDHPRSFFVAERLLPDYQRANAWLDAFEERGGLT